MIVLGLAVIGGVLLNLLGITLAIAGLIQRDRKKVFAILGLIFNGLVVLCVAALMVIGLAV